MPRPRFDNLPEDRRRELLEAAAREMGEHGYAASSLNRIISGTGLSKGSFYYYFDDKADLVGAVARFAFDEVLSSQTDFDYAALDGDSFWPTLEARYLVLLSRTRELPWLIGLGKLLYRPGAGLDEVVTQQLDRVYGYLADLLRHGRSVGAVRDDAPIGLLRAMAVGAMQASDEWFVEHWEKVSDARLEELALVGFKMVKDMVASPRLELEVA